MMTEKILCVDDDPNILAGYKRSLRKEFEINTALGGEEGLRAVVKSGPYAVIVCDMCMPRINGVEFLSRVRQNVPDTVRIMLTGNADLDTAIKVVNEGHIFRFLTKPCPAETMAKVLRAGVEQYKLITAEKELLENTLTGSIKVLTEVLALASPRAFGRAARVKRLVINIACELNIEQTWELEVSAMLSQVGCVTVPEETLAKVYQGKPLSSEEHTMFEAHPQVGSELIGKIPRLDLISQIICYQEKHFDGTGYPEGDAKEEQIPLGARILKLALDYDSLTASGKSSNEAMSDIRLASGAYDPLVVAALERVFVQEIEYLTRSVTLEELRPEMILSEDVLTATGMLLVAKGNEVTPSMCLRLKNFEGTWGGIKQPVKVLVRSEEVVR